MRRLPAYADTIVVGGGPAGCAVAGTLAARSDESVLLLEAGPDYGPHVGGGWPADLLDARDLAESHPWGYDSGRSYPTRTIPFQRARVMGGCSSHNGCAAIWGSRADYDGWAEFGGDGWSTDELLPFFRSASARMRVRIPAPDEITPYHAAMLAAAPSAGIPLVEDLNDLDQPVGIAASPSNIAEGVRWNAAFAYVDPVRGRPNFSVVGDAPVDRLVIEAGRVVGVVVVTDEGPATIRAARVVVAAGTYGSPAILLRSGIGAPDALRALGIAPTMALPGVGENLHDHPAVYLQYSGTKELIARMTSFGRDRWLPEEQTIAKLRSSSCAEAFDIHLYPEGSPYADRGSGWSFIIPVACMTPRSRGRLTLSSPDPTAPPCINHGYLSDPDHADRRVLVDAIAIGRELAGESRLAALLGRETSPGTAVASPTTIAECIERNVVHYYHPVGTCKMGPAGDPGAVVDARGRIHGVEGGYVADCSIMPVIPRANTNIPAAVVGERIGSWLAEG